MSQNNDDALITRIRIHCEHIASDVAQGLSYPVAEAETYEGWYVETKKSFIALQRQMPGHTPTLRLIAGIEQNQASSR